LWEPVSFGRLISATRIAFATAVCDHG